MHILTPVYLINITNLEIYLQLYDSNTVPGKLPLSSTIHLCSWMITVGKGDHPAALVISFIEQPYFCNVLFILIWSDTTQTQSHRRPHFLTLLRTT